jgi:hypothetical protein
MALTPLGRPVVIAPPWSNPQDWPFGSDEPEHQAAIMVSRRRRRTYDELTYHGENAVHLLRERPGVASALQQLAQTGEQLIKATDNAADDLHDRTEEALGRVSLARYSVLNYVLGACPSFAALRL